MRDTRSVYRVVEGKHEEKRSFGRPRSRWEDNIRTDPYEADWESMDWIDLAEDRYRWRAVVNAVMNLRVP
jgi:hypothetical protein